MVTAPQETPAQTDSADFQLGTSWAARSLRKMRCVILGVGWGIVASLFAFVVYFLSVSPNVPDEFGPLPPEHPFHDAVALLCLALAIAFTGAYAIQQVRLLRQE